MNASERAFIDFSFDFFWGTVSTRRPHLGGQRTERQVHTAARRNTENPFYWRWNFHGRRSETSPGMCPLSTFNACPNPDSHQWVVLLLLV